MKYRLLLCLLYTNILQIKYTDGGDASYQSIKNLEDALLSPQNYSTTLRPVKNQKSILRVSVTFSLVAVVSLDTVKQELVTNGLLFIFWNDEVHTWEDDDYDNFNRLAPLPNQVWRPRLLIINTLGERDAFEDDYTHTFFAAEGLVGWVPGGLFHTYCALKLEKFPFDVQDCEIQLCPMSYTLPYIEFVSDGSVNLAFYYPNPGWDLLNAFVIIKNISVVPGETFSCPSVNLKLKRRSATIVLNVIVPVVLLSVLNNLVFIIPIESGEKISYAITVLLSLSVFLSMVSTMTPQVSNVVPALTKYLFGLLLSSVISVAAAILTVYLHDRDEKEESAIQCKLSYQDTVKKLSAITKAVESMEIEKEPQPEVTQDVPDYKGDNSKFRVYNKYRIISRHINKFFFGLMNVVTLVLTMWYFIFATS